MQGRHLLWGTMLTFSICKANPPTTSLSKIIHRWELQCLDMRHQIKYFSPMHFEIWSVEICSGGGSFEICSAMLHSSAWAVLELTPSFLFQIPHVHHVRAFINQPVRTDQEEQVPGLFSAACAKVCTQPAPVSGHSVQKQNNPLWYEAGERATQAAGSLRN